MSFEYRSINGSVHADVDANSEKHSDTLLEYRLERLLGPVNSALPSVPRSLPDIRIESVEEVRRDEQALQLLEDYQSYLRAVQQGEYPVDSIREDEFRRIDSGPEWESRIARARERRIFGSYSSRDSSRSSFDSSSSAPVSDSMHQLPAIELIDSYPSRGCAIQVDLPPARAVESPAPILPVLAPRPSAEDKGINQPGTSKDSDAPGGPMKERGSDGEKRPEILHIRALLKEVSPSGLEA